MIESHIQNNSGELEESEQNVGYNALVSPLPRLQNGSGLRSMLGEPETSSSEKVTLLKGKADPRGRFLYL